MGLFTNRKRNDEDLEGLSEAANMLAQFNTAPEFNPAPETDVAEFAHVDPTTDTTVPASAVDVFPAAPMGDYSPAQPVDDGAAAPFGETFDVASASPTDEVVVAPRRRLQDRPRAQAGNVEIDARGLLELLGVESDSDLIDISEAHQRFLAEHEPSDSDDADAASIKEKIRCEVNTAYASFRLTRAA